MSAINKLHEVITQRMGILVILNGCGYTNGIGKGRGCEMGSYVSDPGGLAGTGKGEGRGAGRGSGHGAGAGGGYGAGRGELGNASWEERASGQRDYE